MAYTVYRNKVATFLTDKDDITSSPINLYTIHLGEDASATLFYCEYTDGQSISYFKPGTSDSQTYTPAPITHDQVQSNVEGKIDEVHLQVSNINRTIGGYLHSYNGLRGCEVNILKVFKGSLTDSTANLRDVYYIDSAVVTQDKVEFTLTSKFNVYDVKLPFRTFRRDQCPWTFKGPICNPASANTTINGIGDGTCGKHFASCDTTYDNAHRFGAFPGIPMRRVIR